MFGPIVSISRGFYPFAVQPNECPNGGKCPSAGESYPSDALQIDDALRQYFSKIEDKPKKYSFKVRIPRNAGRPWVDPSDRAAWLNAMDEEP